MRVVKWGNGLAVRLPASVVVALEVRPGDEIEITAMSAREIRLARKVDPFDTLQSLRRFRGAMPDDFKFVRDDASSG